MTTNGFQIGTIGRWTKEEAELEAEVLALLNAGRKFEAIQLVRSYTDCTLHEAKEFIYALESGN